MIKRTIKPAAGNSRISAEAARAAAYFVYRDSSTGHFVMSKNELSPGAVHEAVLESIPRSGSTRRKVIRTTKSRAAQRSPSAKKR